MYHDSNETGLNCTNRLKSQKLISIQMTMEGIYDVIDEFHDYLYS